MSRQWLTLMAILLVYIPVAIDATVLHVAAPTLSVALGTSGNELLWIIDIYSLVMAGMVLPMGALGDKIGFKRLLLLGSGIFGTASLAAAFSPTAETLIASRALLAVGAAMIVRRRWPGSAAPFRRRTSAIWRLVCGRRSVPAARRSARWLAACCWSIFTGDRFS
jgi:DHA2 family multidrug resistance protein-like MFS transporter